LRRRANDPREHEESKAIRTKSLRLRHFHAVQVNFRVSGKWLEIIKMLATLEGRSSSAIMRELLTLGLAQYVRIYYRTPQLIRARERESVIEGKVLRKTAKATEAAKKRSV